MMMELNKEILRQWASTHYQRKCQYCGRKIPLGQSWPIRCRFWCPIEFYFLNKHLFKEKFIVKIRKHALIIILIILSLFSLFWFPFIIPLFCYFYVKFVKDEIIDVDNFISGTFSLTFYSVALSILGLLFFYLPCFLLSLFFVWFLSLLGITWEPWILGHTVNSWMESLFTLIGLSQHTITFLNENTYLPCLLLLVLSAWLTGFILWLIEIFGSEISLIKKFLFFFISTILAIAGVMFFLIVLGKKNLIR